MAMFGSDLHSFLNKDVKNEITYVITGEKESPEDMIDKNLGYMQLALSSIDALDAMGDVTLDSAKTRAMWFVGLGTGGPAVTAGSMLLLYEVALALFIGLGPPAGAAAGCDGHYTLTISHLPVMAMDVAVMPCLSLTPSWCGCCSEPVPGCGPVPGDGWRPVLPPCGCSVPAAYSWPASCLP